MTIGVDFDGTIVEHKYPYIGEERPDAVATLLKLQGDGHSLILWTVREGELLQNAIDWCAERGLHFFAVNKDYPEESHSDNHYSRKLKVDLRIDDRNLGGLPPWRTIYSMILAGRAHNAIATDFSGTVVDSHQQEMMARYQKSSSRSGGVLSLFRKKK